MCYFNEKSILWGFLKYGHNPCIFRDKNTHKIYLCVIKHGKSISFKSMCLKRFLQFKQTIVEL
jgi:hypothetical protein